MSNKLGIGVEATLDPKGAVDGANKIVDALEEAGKVKIEPVSPQALKTLDALNSKFQQLLKVDAELRRRIKATGQIGKNYSELDWGLTHPDAGARSRKRAAVNDYLGIPNHAPVPDAPPPGQPPGSPPRRGFRDGFGSAFSPMDITQHGLRAGGPIGGVAAQGLGAGAGAAKAGGGFAAGLGAGLGGLLGGLLALGVGKIVGGVIEKVDQAEDNNVMYDRLKRTIGDVGVGFEGLKKVFTLGADQLKVTYGEYGALGEQFIRSGNLQADKYTSVRDEIGVGFGLSRSFGLDPSQGVGIMGQMRGLGVTSDVEKSRRFALLIGETIGKSGAFSKADEVMEAIGSYATMQTRNGMGAANVGGYAGMFSSMVGSRIPGMDPMGAAGILARINASLGAGGAHGEASQFFTAKVGKRMGLDPIQTQILREGGAFATNNEAFGAGSAASRFGIRGPAGDKTFLQGSLEELRAEYGGNKGLLAQATANHLGVNMRQAMALLTLKPNQMDEMQGYAGDLTKLNASGIGNLSKVVYGSAADRESVADSIYRNKEVGQNDKDGLAHVMKNGTEEEQKRLLSSLVAQFGQERTMGRDIADSKAMLDNIKTSLADKLVPLTLEMRHGIMSIAGGGKGKSSEQIMAEVVEADSSARKKAIEGRNKPEENQLLERQNHLNLKLRSLDTGNLTRTYHDKPKVLEEKLAERALAEAELVEVNKRLKGLEEERAALLKKENERKATELANIRDGIDARWQMDDAARAGSAGGGSGGGGSGGGKVGPMDPAKRDEAMRFFMEKGWTREQAAGLVANLGAESGLNHQIVGDGGKAYGIAQWHPDRQARFAAKYGKDIRQSTYREQLEFVNHELTEGREQSAGRLLRQTRTGAQAADVVTRYYERPKHVDRDAAIRSTEAERLLKLKAPEALASGADKSTAVRVITDPIEVRHVNEKGQQVRPAEQIQTRVAPAAPAGGRM